MGKEVWMLESRQFNKFLVLSGDKLLFNETNSAKRSKFSPVSVPLSIGFLPRELVKLQTFWKTYLHVTSDNQLRADSSSVDDEGKW